MKVNAVFEGGGVKAIGLVGALESAERHGFRFQQVAGTSSGALVAAFLAAGYTAQEMKQMILETPFTTFIKKTILLKLKVIGPAARLFIKKGLYSGEYLEYWVQQMLLKKGIRTFGDLESKQLQIIASDISRGKLLVLPDDIAQYGIDPKKFSVARAVRMSTSIPYFFDPVVLRRSLIDGMKNSFKDQFIYIVDGALLSNFPLWIFDEQQKSKNDKSAIIPTIGFQFVGKTTNQARRIIGPLTMFQALFATMMEAHDERYIEDYNFFRTIKIPTMGVQTTQFDIKPEKSMMLYDSGVQAAEYYFNHKWSIDKYVENYNQYYGEEK